MSPLIPLPQARTFETPAAVMRSYVTPSGQTTAAPAVWRTDVPSDTSGPEHTIDTLHVVIVISGELEAVVDGATHHAGPGDCLVLPAGSLRRLTGGPDGAVTITSATAGSTATVGDGTPVRVPWAN